MTWLGDFSGVCSFHELCTFGGAKSLLLRLQWSSHPQDLFFFAKTQSLRLKISFGDPMLEAWANAVEALLQ
jgi:hypothetical protein